MFKVNDLVKIVKQSSSINSHIGMVGLSGFIEEIKGDYAQFMELREDGCGGCGGVPLDCLALANDDTRLQNLKKARDEYIEKIRQEGLARGKRYEKLKNQYVTQAISETGVSKSTVERIFELADKFREEWENIMGW